MDVVEISPLKKSRIDQDLTLIEKSTMAVISIDGSSKKMVKSKETTGGNLSLKEALTQRKSYKVEKQLLSEVKSNSVKVCKDILLESDVKKLEENLKGNNQDEEITEIIEIPISTSMSHIENLSVNLPNDGGKINLNSERKEIAALIDNVKSSAIESKDLVMVTEHQNWLTPSSKKVADPSTRGESISTVQVIDEETRMSAESGSRSQTPARNISAPGIYIIFFIILLFFRPYRSNYSRSPFRLGPPLDS